MPMHESFQTLLKLILPEFIETYFEVTDCKKEGETIHMYLKEHNKTPEEFISNKLTFKGFFDEVTIQDFPIRGSQVLLHVTRRRWWNEEMGKVVIGTGI